MENIVDIILREQIIAVTVLRSREELIPTMDALLAGGVRVLELALRTDFSLEALEIIRDEYPEVVLGVGTVIKTTQLVALEKIGVPFAVAPGLNPKILQKAKELNIPFFPGIATPSDIEMALDYDINLLKFFPAEGLGGLSYLKTMNAPYAHLNLRYIPLGGVNSDNVKAYLRNPLIGAVGGSWIASRDLIEAKNWQEITRQAKNVVAIRDEI